MSKSTEMDTATAVKERPMIFSGPMVKAILDGRKTQTRRVMRCMVRFPHLFGPETSIAVKEGEAIWHRADMTDCLGNPLEAIERCLYGQPGDVLWVRETWALVRPWIDPDTGGVDGFDEWKGPLPKQRPQGWDVVYRADWDSGYDHPDDRAFRWRSPFHLPRWAARITLEITDDRVERVQGIGYRDCVAEGIPPVPVYDDGAEPETILRAIRDEFRELWDSINAVRGFGWEANPWTWAITFKRLKP
jgi:hypothetical protein